ncbi:MAG: MFS transporter, partial [Actinobacteria bacterium]
MADAVAASTEGTAEAESSRAFRTLVRDRRFRLLWMSQFVSGVGDWLVVGFLIPLVTNLSGGSAFAVAGIWIAKIVPSLLFTGVVGALVDRFDRRRLMIACDLVRACLALLLFTNNLAIIYLVVMLMETASLFFNPARNAYIPSLIEPELVAPANGLAYTTQQASLLIGLTASGAILAGFEAIVRWILNSGFPFVAQLVGPIAPELLGPRAGIILDALTFLFSAACIFLILQDCAPGRQGKLSLKMIGLDVIESFRFLRSHRELRGFITAVSLAILGGGSIVALGPVYVAQNLTGEIPFINRLPALERLFATPVVFMLVFAAAGMVAGGLLVTRFERRIR